MPHFSEVPNRPIRGVGFSSSFFLGGISSRSETEKYRKNNLLSTVTTVGAMAKWRSNITEHTQFCTPLRHMNRLLSTRWYPHSDWSMFSWLKLAGNLRGILSWGNTRFLDVFRVQLNVFTVFPLIWATEVNHTLFRALLNDWKLFEFDRVTQWSPASSDRAWWKVYSTDTNQEILTQQKFGLAWMQEIF